MKTFIIAGIAAVIAASSFASSASAEVVLKYENGYHHRNHATVVVRPRARVYIAPRVVYREDCFTKKVRRVNDWGEVVIKRVRVCR
jgi:hypothetical protein